MTDERARCWWANGDPMLRAYHDDEWGRPVSDETHLFEMLTLEGFQAGLSWLTILRKRDAVGTGAAKCANEPSRSGIPKVRRRSVRCQPAAIGRIGQTGQRRTNADQGSRFLTLFELPDSVRGVVAC